MPEIVSVPSSIEEPGIPTEADDSHLLRLLIHVYSYFNTTFWT
jgi:hypothetical protein